MLSPFPPDFGGGGSSATVLDHSVNFAHGMVIGILIGIAATAALLEKKLGGKQMEMEFSSGSLCLLCAGSVIRHEIRRPTVSSTIISSS